MLSGEQGARHLADLHLKKSQRNRLCGRQPQRRPVVVEASVEKSLVWALPTLRLLAQERLYAKKYTKGAFQRSARSTARRHSQNISALEPDASTEQVGSAVPLAMDI